MTTTVGSVVINIDVNTLGLTKFTGASERVRQDVARVGRASIQAGNEISQSFNRAGQTIAAFSGHMGGLGASVRAAGAVLGSLSSSATAFGIAIGGATLGMAAFVKRADDMNRMANNLRTVTKGVTDLTNVQRELFDISQRSRASLDGTVTIYARTARAVEHLGRSQKEVLRIAETIQKAFAVGGASAAEAYGAAIQLSQGIASDRFSGEEFRSVAENAPVLLREMARSLDVNIGKLREMAHAGELTGQVVTQAILDASEAIDRDFGKTIPTIQQNFVKLNNNLNQYIYETDKAYGVTSTLSSILTSLNDNFADVADTALFAGAALASFIGGRMGGALLRGGAGVVRGGLFGGLREQARKDVEAIKKELGSLYDQRKKLEQSIQDVESKRNERLVSQRLAQTQVLDAARRKETDAHRAANDLVAQRVAITNRLSAAQQMVVEGVRQEQREALRIVRQHSGAAQGAARRFSRFGRTEDRVAMEREQKAVTMAQERYRAATERLAVAQRGTFDEEALRRYGGEIRAVNKELAQNHQAQIKAGQELAKAHAGVLMAQRQAPEVQKQARVEMERAAARISDLRQQQDVLNDRYRAATEHLQRATRQTTLLAAAQRRLSQVGSGLLGAVGGGYGLAVTAIIGGFLAISNSINNSVNETEEWKQSLRDAGYLAEEAANKVEEINEAVKTRNLAAIAEEIKKANEEIDKLKRGGFWTRMGWGDAERGFQQIIDDTWELVLQATAAMTALRQAGVAGGYEPDTKAAEAEIKAYNRLIEIVGEVSESKEISAELNDEIQSLAVAYPGINKLVAELRELAPVLKASESRARDLVTTLNSLAGSSDETERWNIIEQERNLRTIQNQQRREAIKGFMDEQIAQENLTDSGKKLVKVTEDLKDEYADFLKERGLSGSQYELSDADFKRLAQTYIATIDVFDQGLKKAEDLTEGVVKAALDGKIALYEMKQAMAGLAAMNPDLEPWIKELSKVAEEAVRARREVANVWAMDESKGGRVRHGAIVLPDSPSAVPSRRPNDIEIMDEQTAERERREAIKARYDLELRMIRARSAAEKAAIAAEQKRIDLIGENISEAEKLEQIEQARRLSLEESAHAAEEAARDRRESRANEVDQLQLEINLIGKTAGEIARATTEYELLRDARREAYEAGWTPEQLEAESARIREHAKSVGELTQALSVQQAMDDLMFERAQIGRSSTEQRVYSELRSLGLDINTIDGQRIANAIRINESLEQQKSLFGDIGQILQGIAEQFAKSEQTFWDFVDALVGGIGAIGDKLMSTFGDGGLFAKMMGGGSSAVTPSTLAAQVAKAVPATYVGSPAHGARGASELQGYSAVTSLERTARSFDTSVAGLTAFIRQAASARNIDPDIAVRVARSEGLAEGVWQSNLIMKSGIREPSYGPFQLYTGGGLGNKFQRQTGLDPRNPNTVFQQIEFALNEAAAGGWGPWYGAAKVGIGNRTGLSGAVSLPIGSALVAAPTAANSDVPQLAVTPVSAPSSSGLGVTGGAGGTFQKFAGAAGALASGFASGYNTQNPLMGAISGGLGAIGTGDPLAIGLGILGGLIGGIVGLKKAIDEARAELDKLRPEMETFFKVGAGEGVSSLAESLREYTDQAREYAKIADKARDFETLDRLREAVVNFQETLKSDFRLGFEATLKSLTSGQGLTGELVQAQQAVLSLREELKAFVADAKFTYGAGSRAAADARIAAGQQLLSMIDGGVEELSDVAFEMQRLEAVLPSIRDAMRDISNMGPRAEASIRERLEKAIAALRDGFNQDLSASINDLSGRGYLNEIADAQERYNQRLKDAAALGLDASGAQEELALTLVSIQKNAGLATGELTAFAEAAGVTVESLRGLYREEVDRTASVLRQTLDVWRDFVDGIAEYRKSLNLNPSLSTLSPLERLNTARSAFEATASAAAMGDRDAMGRLQADASAYLEQAASFWSSSEQYAAIFKQVQSTLLNVETKAASEITIAEQTLSYAEQNVVGLAVANDNLITLVQSSEALRAAVDAYLGVGGTLPVSISEMAAAAIAAAQSSTALVTQSVSEIANAIADASSAAYGSSRGGLSAERQAIVDARNTSVQLGVENKGFFEKVGDWFADLFGFDAGGWTGNMPIGSVAGVVHGQEYVVPAPYAAQYRPLLEGLSSGRGISIANDNREVVAAMNNNARVSASGFNAIVRKLEAVEAELAELKAEQVRTRKAEEFAPAKKSAAAS